MAWLPLTGLPSQFAIDGDSLASGYYLKFYAENTATAILMATDSSGGTTLAKCLLNTAGYPLSDSGDDESVFIPHLEADYRAVLYTNATDADNNTTANAVWNIPSTELRAVITANAADITLRATTLLAQDDFDRSILFTDGDGFTAGAGPHVLTVTSDYTPTDSDFRAWKKDSSGIISSIVTQSETSTTFTYTSTLASTDIIFVGDDSNKPLAEQPTSTAAVRTALVVDSNLSEIADAGASAQLAAVENLAINHTQQLFTASGTWTKPSGCRFVKVECVGGGGGAGGLTGASGVLNNAANGGGGGGAYATSIINVTAITSRTITVGTGGAGGAAGANVGSAGGDTSFGSDVIAKAGTGSNGHTAGVDGFHTGSIGGSASSSTGTIKIDGGDGGSGYSLSSNGIVEGGFGGATMFGLSARAFQTANNYGTGGPGHYMLGTGSEAGEDGADGICIITEYY